MESKKKPLGLVISRNGQHYYIYEEPMKYAKNMENYHLVDDYFGFNEGLDITDDFILHLGSSNYCAIILSESGIPGWDKNNPTAAKICNYYIFKNQFEGIEVTGEMIIFCLEKQKKKTNLIKKLIKP